MQVCTSLQTDNHANTSLLSFLQAGCPSCRPTNSVKALKAIQPAGDVSHKPGGRLPLLSARPAVTPATLERAATKFCCSMNRGTMGVNSLPKTVTRQRRSCHLNPALLRPADLVAGCKERGRAGVDGGG